MNGWLNLYKPKGISSAKAVSLVKRYLKKHKIGHTGTLDLEAEGVLPLAIGQATKLVRVLMDSKKEYLFTIQFGARTTTGDASGEIIEKISYIPSEEECAQACNQFLGLIQQTPPLYSALKINGVRAYKLARNNQEFIIKPRCITIYKLNLVSYDSQNKCATFLTECSKGTYIRSLAEDISLSLQSLGFVIELRRTKVGIFNEENSINIQDLSFENFDEALEFIQDKCLKVEEVLDDIPVLEVDEIIAKKIRYGQACNFDITMDYSQIWLKYENKILAIGTLSNKNFKSLRVFNYIENGEK